MCRKTQQIKVKKFTLSQNSSVSQCEHTLEIKAPASKMALMCLSQPEFSRPHRKSLMDGDLISPTARERASDKKEEEKETQRGDQIDTLAVTPPPTQTHTPLLTIDDSLLAAPHHMNVLNADEEQLDVGVIVLVLIAFTCCSICHGI